MNTANTLPTSNQEMREKIMRLESALLAMPQAVIPIEHFFAPGIYMRQMTMPKDAVITGKIHKTEHYCILTKGSVTLVTEKGREQIHAPHIVHSVPGDKRAIHAHEESVWINIHHNPTNERDLGKIDEIFVADSYDKYLGFLEAKQIQGEK